MYGAVAHAGKQCNGWLYNLKCASVKNCGNIFASLSPGSQRARMAGRISEHRHSAVSFDVDASNGCHIDPE